MDYKEAGNEFFKAGKWAEAIEQYTKGLGDDELPSDARGLLLSNRSQCRLNLEQFQQAFEDADACLRLLPEHTKSLFRRATAHDKMGASSEALSDYARVVKADPKNKAAIEAATRIRESIMKEREQKTDQSLPVHLLDVLRKEENTEAMVEKQMDACKHLRGHCVHRSLTASLIKDGTLELLVKRAADPETLTELREELLSTLGAMASGQETQDDDEGFKPPPRTDKPIAVPTGAAAVRKKLHETLPLGDLRLLCRGKPGSARQLAMLVGFTHELEDKLALEVIHDALSYSEQSKVNVPRAGIVGLAGIADRRRRQGKDGKSVMPSVTLLKCLESSLSTTMCHEPLKCLLATVFTLMSDEDRPKGMEVDLSELGLKILEPFLQSQEYSLKANGLTGLAALLASSTKAAGSVLHDSTTPFQAIMQAIQRPPFGADGKAAQDNAIECLLLATGDLKTRQSLIDSGGIDILLKALGDGEEGSKGLMRAKFVAVLAIIAGHNAEVREEVFDRLDFVLELRTALGVARESSAAARAGSKGAPSMDEARRLYRALYESCACLTIHGEFKESLAESKKTFIAIQELPTNEDLAEDPQLAFFYTSIAYNCCRCREDKMRPKKDEFPYNELGDDDLDAIEEFYDKMPNQSKKPKNGEIDAGPAELAEKLRGWCVVQKSDKLTKPGESTGSPLIGRLAKCAAHGSPRVKSLVAFLFKFLCKDQSRRRYIVSSGGIRTLLGLVDLEEDMPRDAARQALAQILISTNPSLIPYSEQLDAVRPLVQLLEHRHELLQFESAMGLTNLLTASDELRSRAIQGDAWRSCRELLFSDNEMVQRAGVEAMCNLTMAPEILEKFSKGKCELEIRVFISFCNAEDQPTVVAASGALAMLAHWDDIALQIAANEKFDTMEDMLAEAADPNVQHRLVATLGSIHEAEGISQKVQAKIRGWFTKYRGLEGFASAEAETIAQSILSTPAPTLHTQPIIEELD